jgi:phosphohistidine phosphatase
MAEHGLRPDHVLCSSSVRTRATLGRIAQAVGLDVARAEIDERIYLADLPTLLDVLAALPPSAERVLLIGHAPGMEELVVHLTGQILTPDARGKTYPTCALARLRVDGPWETLGAADAELIELLRPRDLL